MASTRTLIVITAFTWANFSFAESLDSVQKKRSHKLPEIITTAVKVDEAAPATTYWESSEIDCKSGNASNCAEALTQTPGLNVQYGASSGDARAWVRGFRDRSVLVLYDGIPIASAFEGTIDLNEISMNSVSKVVTMVSAPSVIYGTNGIGGVIDFIPRDVYEGETAKAKVEAGTNDYYLVEGT